MSETHTITHYLKSCFSGLDRKWHIAADGYRPICRTTKLSEQLFELTTEVPSLEVLCKTCRIKSDPAYKESIRQGALERHLESQAKEEARDLEIQRWLQEQKNRQKQLECQVIDNLNDFDALSMEVQLTAQMLRTIAWIRGYKAFWVVQTVKACCGVNLTIDVVQAIDNEMPSQKILDLVNDRIAKYHQQRLK